MSQKANTQAAAKALAEAESAEEAKAAEEADDSDDDGDEDLDDEDLNEEPAEPSIKFDDVDKNAKYRVRLLKPHQFKGTLYPEGAERTLRGKQVTRNCKVLRKL